MRYLLITVLSLFMLHASHADHIVSNAAEDLNLQSLGDSVEAGETNVPHTPLRVRRREGSAYRVNVTSFTRLWSNRKQGLDERPDCDAECQLNTEGGHSIGPNGNPCTTCDPPKPGRGYDGIGIKTSLLPATPDIASLHDEGNYVLRDDCGNQWFDVEDQEGYKMPASVYIRNTTTSTHNAYPGYTNAWCERGIRQSIADTFANRDPLYQAKTLYTPSGFLFEFFFCKNNGFLSLAARQAVAGGFETARTYARNFCSEKEAQLGKGFIENITLGFPFPAYEATQSRNPVNCTPEEASTIELLSCAMGGTDGLTGGQSDGPLADIGNCVYSYGDLGDGEFCVYDECNGWDPVTGMPVTELMTRAPPGPIIYF